MTTIGTQLDEFLEQVENLSSTQLYGLIVCATVGISILVLGTGPSSQVEWKTKQPPLMPAATTATGPQPRWHWFKYINVFMMIGFVSSVATFLWNFQVYKYEGMGKFVLVWSVFLCYFFGFFGVSLVHQDILHNKPSETSTKVDTEERYVTTIYQCDTQLDLESRD